MTPVLLSLRRSPWLVELGDHGLRAVAGVTRRDPVHAARRGRRGHVAYLHTSVRDASLDWACCLVIHDEFGQIMDVRPRAVVHSPPAFAVDGTRLAYVRDLDGLGREIVDLELANGDERVVWAGEGIRAAVWVTDRTLIVSSSDRIEAIDTVRSESQTVFVDDVAKGFAAFGNDDLYVTLDRPACSSCGDLAWTRTWHLPGRADLESVHVRRFAGGCSSVAQARRASFARDELVVLEKGGLRWTTRGRYLMQPDVDDIDAFEPIGTADSWWRGRRDLETSPDLPYLL